MVRREMENERVWSTQKLGKSGLKLMSFFGELVVFGGGRTEVGRNRLRMIFKVGSWV